VPLSAETSSTVTTSRPVTQGPLDGRIAFIAAKMMEQLHYTRHDFDDSISSELLDHYLETLDPQHIHFLQSDLKEFEPLRKELDDLTCTRRGVADTSPANQIFNRFLLRLEERVSYAELLLKTEAFKFTTEERIALSRKDLPYPADINEARKLWRERLRYEYLQEKLSKIDARKDTEKKKDTKPETKTVKPKKSDAEEIVDTLSHRYQRNLRTFRDWNSDDVLQIYLTTLARVYDPHSDYFGHEQLESFSIGMNLSLFGIGAELTSEDGYCTIRRLLPGGPAEKSKKIKDKDRIVMVGQSNQPPVDVVDMALNKAVQMIRGPKGTEVRLTIATAESDYSERAVLPLIRDEIKLEDQAAKSKLIEMPQPNGQPLRIGIIDVPSFYAPFEVTANKASEPKSTTRDVAKLLQKLKAEKVSGVVLDLRRNGGGSLEEAIRLTGLFIKQGPVVQVRDFQGNIQQDADTDPSVAYDGPLIVLTSRFSASASEILAGALQDYGRALIVGDASTHGKGTVQSVNQIRPHMGVPEALLTNDPGAIKLTIKKFYRASGASTQLRGVVPDIILPSVLNESKDIGEAALDNPLPWDNIKSAKYDALNMVKPYLDPLRERSTNRIARDVEFAYVREDIEQFHKVQADKSISLNEQVRLKEKAELEARQKARDEERKRRVESKDKIYDLTLAQAALPGLPPPVAKTNTATASAKSAALATNSASLASAPASDDPEAEEEKPPAVDATLLETQKILVDYIDLMARNKAEIATTRPASAAN
jgi:carboxyl-terminal processing protease